MRSLNLNWDGDRESLKNLQSFIRRDGEICRGLAVVMRGICRTLSVVMGKFAGVARMVRMRFS